MTRVRASKTRGRCAATLAFIAFGSACTGDSRLPLPIVVRAPVTCPEYYPAVRFDPERGQPGRQTWFAQALRDFDEPCLPDPGDRVDEAYRFLWLRSFDVAVVVRIDRRGEEIWAVSQVGDGREIGEQNARKPGRPSIAFGPYPVDRATWDRIDAANSLANLWGMLLTDTIEDRIFDGADWVLEGWRDGRYHAAARWSPGAPDPWVRFSALCLEVVKAAGLPVDQDRIY